MTAPTPLGTSGFLGASTGNVTSLSPAVGVAVSAGDLIIVTAHAGGSTTISSVTDSQGNTYTLADSQANSSGAVVTTAVYVGVATTALGTSDTITVNRSTSGSLVVGASKVAGYSGTPRTTSKAFSNTSTTAMNAGAVADAASGELIVVAVTTQTGRTLSGNSDTTLIGQLAASGSGNPRLGGSGYIDVASTGSVTPGLVASSGNGYAAVAVVLEPAAGAPPSANAGADQIVKRADTGTVTLDGTASTDSDGSIVGYLWEQLTGPETVTISGSTSSTATFPKAVTPGDYTFRLTVTDNDSDTGTDDVAVRITPARTVCIIGDSLTERDDTDTSGDRYDETLAQLFAADVWPDCANTTQAAFGLHWYGRGGKRMNVADSLGNLTTDNIADARTELGTVDVWIIGLGTNDVVASDATFNADQEVVLDEIAGEGIAYWVGLSFWNPANTNAAHFNPLLEANCDAASNTVFVDYNTDIHNPHVEGDWIGSSDPTHMTTQGYTRRDAIIGGLILQQPSGTAALTLAAAGAGSDPPTTGEVTAALILAASATGEPIVTGSGSAGLVLAASAAGESTVTGSATAGLVLAASGASASTTVTGTASAALTLAASGDGSSTVTGSATAALALSASASGSSTVTGTAAAGLVLSAAADGSSTVTGSGAAALQLDATSNGSPIVTGDATADLILGGDATGIVDTGGGSVSALLVLGTQAEGTSTVTGEASAGLTVAAAATGAPVIAGAASAALTLTATGTSTSSVAGDASADLTLTASASGTSTVTGAATVALTIAADATGTGTAPTITPGLVVGNVPASDYTGKVGARDYTGKAPATPYVGKVRA